MLLEIRGVAFRISILAPEKRESNLVEIRNLGYNKLTLRGCTGFDRDCAAGEAIRMRCVKRQT